MACGASTWAVKKMLSRMIRVPLFLIASLAWGAETASSARPADHPLHYINTSFENASPLWYEFMPDGTALLHLIYDLERNSPNRAAGHIHFQLQGEPGAALTLEFTNLNNVWNGAAGSVASELKRVVVSEDGYSWRSIELESLPGDRVRLHLKMPGPRVYVARVEPYRLSDLEKLLALVRSNPFAEVTGIGRTVQGRELEMIRIGNPQAGHRAFLRARAHPWEAGSSWVVAGLIDRLLQNDAEAARYRERYCVYILPMANKDGVAMGRTRFNAQGRDLNRGWNQPAEEQWTPENCALEKWLERMIQEGRKPELAIELHNDGRGLLHISRAPVPELSRYLQRMELFEKLLREHTWFTEGSSESTFRNSGSLGEGWLERYEIDAVIHELNCNWIAGLQEPTSARHWRTYGGQLARVLFEYFE